ncbi:hypothetical protein [Phenylobacterium aquaticum]|uniref:hypothetical protein n=1 Tax=Phenylobacterium aquaticum TaxID=1763816 RepID=UPI001F5D0DBE|nr:hypothetical protein [Phenylobacterium aquaticum]MCI3135244.1 hypothetical protein [Phenylobacterium aquaticum]
MKIKASALGVLFRALAAISALGLVSATATAAYGAFAASKDTPGYAVELASKIKQAIDDISLQRNEDGSPKYNLGSDATVADYKAAILAAVQQATMNSADDDPELVSAALGMVAAQYDVLTPGSTLVAANFVTAFQAVQQEKLQDAIVDAVQDAVRGGGQAASDKAIAADIAKTINMANLPAASVKAAFSSASSQLAQSGIGGAAVTTAMASVDTAIQSATGNIVALPSTSSNGDDQSNTALNGSLVDQPNSGGLGTDTAGGQVTTVYVG